MRSLPTVALSFFLLAPAAFAAPPEPAIRPVYQADNSFSFCLGEQLYDGGRVLTVALSPKGEINLGSTIPLAGFRRGERYDIGLTLDGSGSRTVRAQALSPDTLLLQMGANAAFRKNLETTRVLALGAGGKTITFALPDMGKWMRTLEKCLDDNQGRRMTGTLPAAPNALPAPTVNGEIEISAPRPQSAAPAVQTAPAAQVLPSPPLPTRMVEAPAAPARVPAPAAVGKTGSLPPALKKLLEAAKLTPVTPLSLEGTPADQRPADVIWQKGKILGGVKERRVPEDKDLAELIGLHMEGLEKKCAGAFSSDIERERRAPDIWTRKAVARCAPRDPKSGEPVTVALFFTLAKNGLFTVYTHEGAGAAKAEALKARDALAETLMKEVKETGGKAPFRFPH